MKLHAAFYVTDVRPARASCARCDGSGEWVNSLGQAVDCLVCVPPPALCERCDEPTDAYSSANIPDIWGARYLTLCDHCAAEGHRAQAHWEYERYD